MRGLKGHVPVVLELVADATFEQEVHRRRIAFYVVRVPDDTRARFPEPAVAFARVLVHAPDSTNAATPERVARVVLVIEELNLIF